MRRPDLVADCARCTAICCMATSFDASDDFALDKPAGVACRYLEHDHRCAIHGELAVRGFPGCAAYDCYGAGPRATRAFAGHTGPERDELFRVLRPIHELLWLLTEAVALCPASQPGLVAELAGEIAALDALAEATVVARDATAAPDIDRSPVLSLDLSQHDRRARLLLRRVGDALGGRRPARRSLPIASPGS